MRLLFIDDDQLLRELARPLLATTFDLTICGPEDAVSLIEREDFDIIVSDLYMGEISGLDIVNASKLKAQQPPVILITAGDIGDKLLQLSIDSGACGYIEKPFGGRKEFIQKLAALTSLPNEIVTKYM